MDCSGVVCIWVTELIVGVDRSDWPVSSVFLQDPLGPLLFSFYVPPIANVIAGSGVSHAQYADNTQLYVSLKDESALSSLSDCFKSGSLVVHTERLVSESWQVRSYHHRPRHSTAIRGCSWCQRYRRRSNSAVGTCCSLGVTIHCLFNAHIDSLDYAIMQRGKLPRQGSSSHPEKRHRRCRFVHSEYYDWRATWLLQRHLIRDNHVQC